MALHRPNAIFAALASASNPVILPLHHAPGLASQGMAPPSADTFRVFGPLDCEGINVMEAFHRDPRWRRAEGEVYFSSRVRHDVAPRSRMDRKLGERYGYAFIGAAFVIPILSLVTGGLLLLFIIVFAMIRPERQIGGPAEVVR